MKRHLVIVFNRPTEEVERIYVKALDAGGAGECAREHYRKRGWEPAILVCILSRLTDRDFITYDSPSGPLTELEATS
jgi:hypothetical protein